jgi:hypothetical protein
MNIYLVTGILKGFSMTSVEWTVSSQKNKDEFTKYFEDLVPEYNIDVYQFPSPEMYILNFKEL